MTVVDTTGTIVESSNTYTTSNGDTITIYVDSEGDTTTTVADE